MCSLDSPFCHALSETAYCHETEIIEDDEANQDMVPLGRHHGLPAHSLYQGRQGRI